MSNIQALPGTEEIVELDQTYVMGTYARRPVVFVRGSGTRLWDAHGREYLDFLGGIAVCGTGHCHPKVAEAISRQASTLLHVSNYFYNPLQPVLAHRLAKLTGMERAFFCNSGAEANECAIKIARKWAKQRRGPNCFEIITFHGSFHGRTLATVTATAQPKYQEPFAPLPGGFKYATIGNLQELDEAIDEETCAVMIEPIQGESGIHVVPPEFLKAVRLLCDEAGILLILDEVQSGNGRTGRFLASQHADIRGDIVTLAKGIASGVPMGVCLARGEAAQTLAPGDHGSTFGGQPLACAAALATLDVIEEEDLIANARVVGQRFMDDLRALQKQLPGAIVDVRGMGLMVGVELAGGARQVQDELLQRGIVVNAIGETTLRFLPPLTVTVDECRTVTRALGEILRAMAPVA